VLEEGETRERAQSALSSGLGRGNLADYPVKLVVCSWIPYTHLDQRPPLSSKYMS